MLWRRTFLISLTTLSLDYYAHTIFSSCRYYGAASRLVGRGGDAEAEGGGRSGGGGGGCGGDGTGHAHGTPHHDRWGVCGGGVRRAILAGERRISERNLVSVSIETSAPPPRRTAAAAARFAGEKPGVSGREGGWVLVAIALSAGRKCVDAGGGWGGCGRLGGGCKREKAVVGGRGGWMPVR